MPFEELKQLLAEIANTPYEKEYQRLCTALIGLLQSTEQDKLPELRELSLQACNTLPPAFTSLYYKDLAKPENEAAVNKLFGKPLQLTVTGLSGLISEVEIKSSSEKIDTLIQSEILLLSNGAADDSEKLYAAVARSIDILDDDFQTRFFEELKKPANRRIAEQLYSTAVENTETALKNYRTARNIQPRKQNEINKSNSKLRETFALAARFSEACERDTGIENSMDDRLTNVYLSEGSPLRGISLNKAPQIRTHIEGIKNQKNEDRKKEIRQRAAEKDNAILADLEKALDQAAERQDEKIAEALQTAIMAKEDAAYRRRQFDAARLDSAVDRILQDPGLSKDSRTAGMVRVYKAAEMDSIVRNKTGLAEREKTAYAKHFKDLVSLHDEQSTASNITTKAILSRYFAARGKVGRSLLNPIISSSENLKAKADAASALNLSVEQIRNKFDELKNTEAPAAEDLRMLGKQLSDAWKQADLRPNATDWIKALHAVMNEAQAKYLWENDLWNSMDYPEDQHVTSLIVASQINCRMKKINDAWYDKHFEEATEQIKDLRDLWNRSAGRLTSDDLRNFRAELAQVYLQGSADYGERFDRVVGDALLNKDPFGLEGEIYSQRFSKGLAVLNAVPSEKKSSAVNDYISRCAESLTDMLAETEKIKASPIYGSSVLVSSKTPMLGTWYRNLSIQYEGGFTQRFFEAAERRPEALKCLVSALLSEMDNWEKIYADRKKKIAEERENNPTYIDKDFNEFAKKNLDKFAKTFHHAVLAASREGMGAEDWGRIALQYQKYLTEYTKETGMDPQIVSSALAEDLRSNPSLTAQIELIQGLKTQKEKTEPQAAGTDTQPQAAAPEAQPQAAEPAFTKSFIISPQNTTDINTRIRAAESIGKSSDEYMALLDAYRLAAGYSSTYEALYPGTGEILRDRLHKAAAAYYNAKLPQERNATRNNRMAIARDLFEMTAPGPDPLAPVSEQALQAADALQMNQEYKDTIEALFTNERTEVFAENHKGAETDLDSYIRIREKDDAYDDRYAEYDNLINQYIRDGKAPTIEEFIQNDPYGPDGSLFELVYRLENVQSDPYESANQAAAEPLNELVFFKESLLPILEKDTDLASFFGNTKNEIDDLLFFATDGHENPTISKSTEDSIEASIRTLLDCIEKYDKDAENTEKFTYSKLIQNLDGEDAPQDKKDALLNSLKKYLPDFDPTTKADQEFPIGSYIANRCKAICSDLGKCLGGNRFLSDFLDKARAKAIETRHCNQKSRNGYGHIVDQLSKRIQTIDRSQLFPEELEALEKIDTDLALLQEQIHETKNTKLGQIHETVIDPKILHDLNENARYLQEHNSDFDKDLLKDMAGLKAPQDEFILGAKMSDANKYNIELAKIRERLDKTAGLIDRDSPEYKIMLSELDNLQNTVRSRVIDCSFDDADLLHPDITEGLNKLKDAAADYFGAKMLQDKNATRLKRMEIAEEIMGLMTPADWKETKYRNSRYAQQEGTRITQGDIRNILNVIRNNDLQSPEKLNDFLNDATVRSALDGPGGIEFSRRLPRIDNQPQTEAIRGVKMVYDILKSEAKGWEVMNNAANHSKAEIALARRDIVLGKGLRSTIGKTFQKINDPDNESDVNLRFYRSIALNEKKLDKLKVALLQGDSVIKAEKEINQMEPGKNFSAGAKLQDAPAKPKSKPIVR